MRRQYYIHGSTTAASTIPIGKEMCVLAIWFLMALLVMVLLREIKPLPLFLVTFTRIGLTFLIIGFILLGGFWSLSPVVVFSSHF
ncbi:hypothetical protein QL285_071643 [Trifolium repens]|nr:hypothetical protein QL285_071643 [Trifolium repens]